MNLALSKKDQCLLIGLLGAIFLFVAWYFVYTPLQEKTMALETENVALKAKADLYQSINANLPKYEEGIVTFEQQIAEIGNRYPVHISREDEIMFLANMENVYSNDLAVENITMSAVVEVVADSVAAEAAPAPEAAAEAATDVAAAPAESEVVIPEVHMYKQPVNYSFRCTYDGAKEMITYVLGQSQTKAIEGMSLAFDSETGNLMGTLDLNQYYMMGLEKEYQAVPVPVVPKGVNDVFHTVNGNAGVQADVQAEAQEDEDAETETE